MHFFSPLRHVRGGSAVSRHNRLCKASINARNKKTARTKTKKKIVQINREKVSGASMHVCSAFTLDRQADDGCINRETPERPSPRWWCGAAAACSRTSYTHACAPFVSARSRAAAKYVKVLFLHTHSAPQAIHIHRLTHRARIAHLTYFLSRRERAHSVRGPRAGALSHSTMLWETERERNL